MMQEIFVFFLEEKEKLDCF
jgi:hypothetical protein